MKIEQNPNEMIITETPGCLWLFGLFFAVIGGLFVYGAAGGASNYDSQSLAVLALSFAMGLTAVTVGIWIVYRAPITRVVINRLDKLLILTQYKITGRRQFRYDFDQIDEFFLIEGKDDEDSPIWWLAMRLTNDEVFKISALPNHDELFKRRFVLEANQFIGKQLLPSELIFELEDETDGQLS